MSEERNHSAGENPEWLNRSYQDWDTGAAGENLWDRLDESLSLEAVWNRMDQSLAQEERSPDTWIQEAHENWDAGVPADQWSKLDETLSLEQVWTGLTSTLDKPVFLVTPLWKFIAASLAALFMVNRMSDTPMISEVVIPAFFTTQSSTATLSEALPVTAAETATVENAPVNNALTGTAASSYTATNYPSRSKWIATPGSALLTSVSRPLASGTDLPGETIVPISKVSATIAEEEEVPVSYAVIALPRKGMEASERDRVSPEYEFKVRVPYRHWTVQIGSQVSYLREDHQSLLTSTAPRLSLAADVSYRHRIGGLELIHAFGLSQYSQGIGKYVNGRYENAEQRVNALQLSGSLAYSHGRTTVYAGLLCSKIMNGLEQKANTVTKVYNNRPIQPGATFGIDYRILSFASSGKHISAGGQYQWIPGIKSQHASFDQIQGVRFQVKYSF